MQITSTYRAGGLITVTCHNFSPADTICQKVQNQLESKKFKLLGKELDWRWQRDQFDSEIKSESFDFWLEQVSSLCARDRFGGNKPVEIVEPQATPTLDTSRLQAQITELQEEIERLKKFDSSANEILQRWKESLKGLSTTTKE